MNLQERADCMILELKWILEFSIPRMKYDLHLEELKCKKKRKN